MSSLPAAAKGKIHPEDFSGGGGVACGGAALVKRPLGGDPDERLTRSRREAGETVGGGDRIAARSGRNNVEPWRGRTEDATNRRGTVEMGAMMCRGVRGATTVEANERGEILQATRQLLALMIRANEVRREDVGSAAFTVTKDLDAEFPALAARQLGWLDVPLLCSYEISVPGSLGRCIRILIHWNTDKAQSEIRHVYLKDAQRLRPDLNRLPPVDFQELESWIAEQMQQLEL